MQEDLLAKFEELYEELHGRMTSPHPHLEQIYDQLIGRTSLKHYNLIVCFYTVMFLLGRLRKNHLEFIFLLKTLSFTEFQSTIFSLFSRKLYESYIIFWLDGRRSKIF
jgi:hypothetical protein